MILYLLHNTKQKMERNHYSLFMPSVVLLNDEGITPLRRFNRVYFRSRNGVPHFFGFSYFIV